MVQERDFHVQLSAMLRDYEELNKRKTESQLQENKLLRAAVSTLVSKVNGLDKANETAERRLKMVFEEIENLVQENRDLQEEVTRKDEELCGKDEELRQKGEVLGRKEEEIRKTKEELGKKDELLCKKDQHLGEKDEELRKRDEVIHKKDEEICKKDDMLQAIRVVMADEQAATEGHVQRQRVVGHPRASHHAPRSRSVQRVDYTARAAANEAYANAQLAAISAPPMPRVRRFMVWNIDDDAGLPAYDSPIDRYLARFPWFRYNRDTMTDLSAVFNELMEFRGLNDWPENDKKHKQYEKEFHWFYGAVKKEGDWLLRKRKPVMVSFDFREKDGRITRQEATRMHWRLYGVYLNIYDVIGYLRNPRCAPKPTLFENVGELSRYSHFEDKLFPRQYAENSRMQAMLQPLKAAMDWTHEGKDHGKGGKKKGGKRHGGGYTF